MKRLATLAAGLLILGCSALPPASRPAPAGTAGIHVDVGLARALLATARRWTAGDVNVLKVKLLAFDGTTYVDAGVGRDLVLREGPVPTSATFANLAAGKRYRVTVEAWGAVGGAAATTLLNAASPIALDFDFLGDQDVEATKSGTATVVLDPVAFSGTVDVQLPIPPAGAATETVELWEQGAAAPTASQTFTADRTGLRFGGLRAGPTYQARLAVKDAGSSQLATGQSAALRFDPAQVTLEQASKLAITLDGATPAPTPTPTPDPTPTPVAAMGTVLNRFTLPGGPYGLAFDSTGNLWTNTDTEVLKLSSATGTILRRTPVSSQSLALVADRNDHVWVTHSVGGLVSVTEYDNNASFVRNYNVDSSSVDTWGVAINLFGDLVVGSRGLGQLFMLQGTAFHSFFFQQGASGVTSLASDQSGRFWTTSSATNELWSANPRRQDPPLAFRTPDGPRGVVVDDQGYIWVACMTARSVSKFTQTGGLVGTYPVPGGPWYLAIDLKGNVWATLFNEGKVCVLSPTGTLLATYNAGAGSYAVTRDARGNIWTGQSAAGTITEYQP